MPHQAFRLSAVAPALALGALAIVVIVGMLFQQPAAADPPDPTPGATNPVREQNLDAAGLIRVHEQGTADVNVTNTPLDVQGSVDVDNFPTSFEVSNFPDVQDVNVTGGTLSNVVLAPVTKSEEAIFFPLSAGSTETQNFATVNATTVLIHDVDDEISVFLLSPLSANVVFLYSDGQGNQESVQRSFVHPLPVNGVSVSCHNESEDCEVFVEILGF